MTESQNRLENMFMRLRDAVVLVDEKTCVIEANERIKSICAYSFDQISGKKLVDLPNDCSKSCCRILLETLASNRAVMDYPVECRRDDRPNQIVFLTSVPLLDENSVSLGAVLAIRDITGITDRTEASVAERRFKNIIGASQPMLDIYGLLDDLAETETTVLITGESGTGKDLIAEALHYDSPRASKQLVKVNCSSLPENLLESELFGHVKGAFTGAIKDHIGRFEKADGGTIFLDEIGDISPGIRLRLLRVLEEKKFERVGDSNSLKVDVRVIAATKRDLREKISSGEFQEDLYYRVKVVEIVLPPLRERTEDIPLLVDHFCSLFNKQFRRRIRGTSEDVLVFFMNYPWPGNVRELKHVIEHAFVLCHGETITWHHLPAEMKRQTPQNRRGSNGLFSDEAGRILHVLHQTDWNKAKTARLLGVSRQTLYRKIARYKLVRTDGPPLHGTHM